MAESDCLFCKIVAGDLPATVVYEDDHAIAFEDLNPQAPTHVLVIPRAHFRDVADLGRDPEAAGGFVSAIRGYTQHAGLTDFRTVLNTGAAVGQSVFHVHAHVLAGRPMGWPPG